MTVPDLITESGRDGVPVKDRVQLLKNELLMPPLNGVTDVTRASTQAIHDLKLLRGMVMNVVELYAQARGRGTTDEALQRGANRMLSTVECRVLAWRRGGHAEEQRVRREQRAREAGR